MNKLMDKLFNTVRFDKKYVMFNLFLVIFGIVCGSFFIVILNKTDKNLVVEYVTNFIDSIKNNNFNTIETFKNTIILNIGIILVMIIFGISTFLCPINILIVFYKSFILGFSLSSFILSYKIKGLLLSIIYIFPHLIINLVLFAILTAFTLKLSYRTIKYIINKKDFNIRLYFNKYLYVFLIAIFIILVSSLYESFIMPVILRKLMLL